MNELVSSLGIWNSCSLVMNILVVVSVVLVAVVFVMIVIRLMSSVLGVSEFVIFYGSMRFVMSASSIDSCS